jgi:predicted secreted protein
MRLRVVTLFAALVLLLPAPAMVLAVDPAPAAPPTVTGLCATDLDYFWTISSDLKGLATYDIEYSTSFADWNIPDTLVPQDSGVHSVVVVTGKDAGTTLSARWAAFPNQVGSSSSPSTTACEAASIALTVTVQGGTVNPTAFAASITGVTVPSFDLRQAVAFTSGVPVAIPAGSYIVNPRLDQLPAGYLWRSTRCNDSTATDPKYARLAFPILPGEAWACEIVYHYGPTLTDAIAPGVNRGTVGFGVSTISVPNGTYVTYLVRTDPSLAGRVVQIWTRTATGAWKLATSRNVASDGTAHHYARVSAQTGFRAKWAGDDIFVASIAHGRIATASTSGETRLSITCDEFAAAQDPVSGKSPVQREAWIRVGSTVTFTLCSNASTGFGWGTLKYDHAALVLTKHVSSPPKTPMPGAAGTERWTFRVLRATTSTVSVAYSRPWDGGEKGLWTLTLKVHGQR